MTRVLELYAALLLLCLGHPISSHPQCINSFAPFDTVNLEFCSDYSMFGCCDKKRDREIKQQYQLLSKRINSLTCRGKLQEILCQECSPYAAHLYATELGRDTEPTAFPLLCKSYCMTFHQQCASIVPLITNDQAIINAVSTSSTAFCKKVSLNSEYCYPRIRDDPNMQSWIEESRTGTGRYQDGCLCLEEVANGLRNPILAVHANDGTHRLFIAEQIGVIHVYLPDKRKLSEPFLDIRSQVMSTKRAAEERGFLGLAFHPKHALNRKLYIYYTHGSKTTHKVRLAEYQTFLHDINKVDLSTERVILDLDKPRANHNSGQMLFGPDGYMYVFLGDGGGAGDPHGEHGNGQNLTNLFGSVIRIDVDRQENGRQYGIPPDNPFVNEDPAVRRHEIFAHGTRNMWRCSVDRGDRETGEGRGRIFCGDVGQDKFEEVDIIIKGGNYGWRGREGTQCYDEDICQQMENEVLPITVYPHNIGKAVIGGYVYRGCQSPKLNGKYIFGDYVNGRMFKLTEEEDGQWKREDICFGDGTTCTGHLVNTYPTKILSFGEDEAGEVYVMTTNQARITNPGGKVFRIVEPSESGQCVINKVPFEIRGSTTNFVPSETGQLRLNCPLGCPGKNRVITEDVVCATDMIFKGYVRKQFLVSTFRIVRINMKGIYHIKPGLPRPRRRLTLTVVGSTPHCPCPEFFLRESFIIFATYQSSWNRYYLTWTSIAKEFNWNTESQIRTMKKRC